MRNPKQDKTPLCDVALGPLLDAARERWNVQLQELLHARMLLGVIASCVEANDSQGLKNLLTKIKEAASHE